MGGRWKALVAVAVVAGVVVPLAVIAPSRSPDKPYVVISEVMTSNAATILDEAGESADWIELWNRSSTRVDLTGWQLSDDRDDDNNWSLPEFSLEPDERVVIFASGKAEQHPFHTDFRLAADGEYLGLRNAAGSIVAEYRDLPGLGIDISYGLGSDGQIGVLTAPTPGLPNSSTKPALAAKPTLSQAGGYIDGSVSVVATTTTDDAKLWYTTDGSTPTTGHGTQYSGAIAVDSTTTLRIVATREDLTDSFVASATFLVMSEVLAQSGTPVGWNTNPPSGQVYEFGFDQEFVGDHRAAVTDALLAAPTFSIITDIDNLTDDTRGIYSNPFNDGPAWERPASMELIDGDKGFQINGGIRLKGGHSRRTANPKHSLQLIFGAGYEGELNYPLLGSDGPQLFGSVDLRTEQTRSWVDESRRDRSTMMRDQFMRDSHQAAGAPSTRSRWVHLFLNGQYWGLYMLRDKVSATHAGQVWGDSSRGYDVLKHSDDFGYEVADGDDDVWLQLWNAIEDGKVTDEEFEMIERGADLANLATFMLVNFATGSPDGIPALTLSRLRANNWQAVGGDTKPFQFFHDDGELTLDVTHHNVNIDNLGPFPLTTANEFWAAHNFNPGWLHEVLLTRPEYLAIFRERAAVLLADDGPLGRTASTIRWKTLRDQMDSLIDAEAARWGYAGPYELGRAYWEAEVEWVETVWLPKRTSVILEILVARGILEAS